MPRPATVPDQRNEPGLGQPARETNADTHATRVRPCKWRDGSGEEVLEEAGQEGKLCAVRVDVSRVEEETVDEARQAEEFLNLDENDFENLDSSVVGENFGNESLRSDDNNNSVTEDSLKKHN